ncbi:hypothetical protein [Rhodopila sp.]|uniref:hypothetical protein n=1 Tax=Rhodopila sp. TaxID=2480087 RepID=UPI003D10053B
MANMVVEINDTLRSVGVAEDNASKAVVHKSRNSRDRCTLRFSSRFMLAQKVGAKERFRLARTD